MRFGSKKIRVSIGGRDWLLCGKKMIAGEVLKAVVVQGRTYKVSLSGSLGICFMRYNSIFLTL